MLSLTREEALTFVDLRLGIKDAEKLLVEDRFKLLNDLILAFHNNVPFQTLTNMAVSPEMRRIPDLNQIKEDVFSGRGGLCIALNGFFYALLSTFGYDCYIAGCKMWDLYSDTHIVIIVQNLLQPDDVFLVEVGVGHPTLGAIALDFDMESSVVAEFAWWGKFERVPETDGEKELCPTFLRRRKPRNPEEFARLGFGLRESPDGWTTIYRFKLEPDSFEDLYKTIDEEVYQNLSCGLSRSIRLIQWRANRAIIIFNNRLIMETDGAIQSIHLETDDEIAEAIGRQFPIFEMNLVRRAIKQWTLISSK